MTMIQKLQMVLLKSETEYGTDSNPTPASNAVLVYDPATKFNIEELERAPSLPDLGQLASKDGIRTAELSFSVDFSASASKGVAPEIGDLLQAFGFAETVRAGSSVSYSPTTCENSLTAYHYNIDKCSGSAILNKLTGCVGRDLKITIEAGKLVKMEATLVGLYKAPADVTAPATPTYVGTPQVAKNQTITIDGVSSLAIQSISIDLGNEISIGEDLGGTWGVNDLKIIKRKPMIEINPERVPVSTYDWWSEFANEPVAVSFDIGTGTGKITITAPAMKITDISQGDKEGRLVDEVTAQLSRSTGDDEFSINFA